jgi:hypothetical protein
MSPKIIEGKRFVSIVLNSTEWRESQLRGGLRIILV